MNKKLTTLIVLALVSASSAYAAGKEVNIAVKGMVCGFCAQGIQKKFSAEPAVDKVNVSLKDKRVTLNLKDGQDMSDDAIRKILLDSGYNVDKVERK